MYCFCTAGMPIRAILAISEDVVSAMGEPLQQLFFQYLWQYVRIPVDVGR